MADAGFTPFPTAAPGGPANTAFRGTASPESFGSQVAGAGAKVGAAISEVGEELFKSAEYRASIQNELLANDSNSEATQKLGSTFGEFSKLEGRNASEAVDKYKEDVKAIVDDAVASAPNLAAKKLLSNSLRYMGDRYINYGQMHSDAEFNKWQHQSTITAADTATNEAFRAATLDDPNALAVSLGVGLNHQDSIADLSGLDEVGRKALKSKWMGDTISEIVRDTAAKGNVEKAQAIFDKYKDQMDGKSQLQVDSALKPIKLKIDSTDIAQRAASPTGGAAPAEFSSIERQHNLPAGFLVGTYGIESNYGRNKSVSSAGAAGPFQVMPATAAQYGLKDVNDLRESAEMTAKLAQDNMREMKPILGRDPTAGELYLAHQQGAHGATQLLIHPESNAAQLIGLDAVRANLPDSMKGRAATITGGEFAQYWISHFNSPGARGISDGAPVQGAMAPKSIAYERILAETEGNPQLRTAALSQANALYSQFNTETAAQRAVLDANVPRMISDVASGDTDPSKVPFDTSAIWNNYPADKAQSIIDEYSNAVKVGQFMQSVKWDTPEEIGQIKNQLDSGAGVVGDLLSKSSSDPDSYYKLKSQADDHLQKLIDRREKELKADPAGYVLSNPTVNRAAQSIIPNDSKSFADFAFKSMAVQQHLGLDGQFTHVLTKDSAEIAVRQITSNAGNAKATLDTLQKTTGDAWPFVYRDLVTLGKMPPEYQAMQILTDPGDLTIMSKALQEMNKDPTKDWSFRLGAGDSQAGAGTKKSLDLAVISGMSDYDNSLRQSGASERDIENIDKAVQVLAYGNQYFNKDPAAAPKAVQSFVGQYSYMAQGGARVPTSLYPKVNLDAQKMLAALDSSNIKIPDGVGQPGQPSGTAYLAWVKSAPEWVTAPTGDRLLLREPGGMGRAKYVRGNDGQPVSVMFTGDLSYSPNFSLPKPEAPRVSVTSETKPGGEPIEGFSDSASKAIQIYRNSLMESGSFTPEQVEQKVNEYKTNFKRVVPK